jgi:hypothetical protein
MIVRLGIITAQPHIELIKSIHEELCESCEIEIIQIDNPREAQEAYMKYAPFVDGFVFSGRFLFDAVDKDCLSEKKPVRILQDSEIILYRELFRLLLTEPTIDISRIYIDFAYLLDSFREFIKYLPPQEKPIQNADLFEQMDLMLENHLAMWDQGKTDLSITAFGHFVPTLQKHGVRYLLIQPSVSHMQDVILGLINEITILKLQNRRTVIGCISISSTSGFDPNQAEEFMRLLNEFVRRMNVAASIQAADDGSIRLFTTYGDFMKITSEARDCALIRAIQTSVSYEVKIGWGLGQGYVQANENAARALQQAKAYPGSCSFYVSDELRVIGPLRSSDVIQYLEHGDARTIALADAIGMNNINLQKIMSYAKMIGTNKITSEDVARCLSITVRGANRILNKIEEKSQAKSIFERLDSGKGRPKKYYELLFLNNEGEMVSER